MWHGEDKYFLPALLALSMKILSNNLSQNYLVSDLCVWQMEGPVVSGAALQGFQKQTSRSLQWESRAFHVSSTPELMGGLEGVGCGPTL